MKRKKVLAVILFLAMTAMTGCGRSHVQPIQEVSSEEVSSMAPPQESVANTMVNEISVGLNDTPGINLNYDLSQLHFLLAPDNTASMMGYSADPSFGSMMKGLENINNSYVNSTVATLKGNENRAIRWFPYTGNVAVGVTRTDKSYPYYCSGGTYDDKYVGPMGLLLKDENQVGAFAENTVTTMVTDLHEQGGTLYSIGNEIRKKTIENLGDEKEFAITIFSFDFNYDGISYVVDPQDLSHSIAAILNGYYDQKPLYVIMAGQKEGVYDYSRKFRSWLNQNDISYEMMDNLRVVEDSEAHIEWTEAATANAKETKSLNKSKSDTKEAEMEEYLMTHITRLTECDTKNAAEMTEAKISDSALCYTSSKMEINSSYKGFWNWCGTYVTERAGKFEEIPYTTCCDSVQVYQDMEGEWVELSQKEWSRLFWVVAEDGTLRISSRGKETDGTYKNQNFRFVFHMQQSIKKEESYPTWIMDKDLSLSGILENANSKSWHQKTMDLDLFCRSMLAMDTSETVIDCGVSHSADIEVITLNMTCK